MMDHSNAKVTISQRNNMRLDKFLVENGLAQPLKGTPEKRLSFWSMAERKNSPKTQINETANEIVVSK